MFQMVLKLLKFINIGFLLIVLFNILSFGFSYVFDTKYKDEINKIQSTHDRNELEISTLKELIETRDRLNKNVIEEAIVKDEVIALKINELLEEILDKEIGLFKITNLSHAIDNKYINLYRTKIDIFYNKNKLFTFYDLQSEILKEINKKINLINSDDFELKIGSYYYDDTTSVFSINILTKKTILSEVSN